MCVKPIRIQYPSQRHQCFFFDRRRMQFFLKEFGKRALRKVLLSNFDRLLF